MTHAWTPAPSDREPDDAQPGDANHADHEGHGDPVDHGDPLPDAESDSVAEPAVEATDSDGEDDTLSTGDSRVDGAVSRLSDLDERDLDEHADVYDTIHSDLADVLDDATRPSSEQ
jgi:hypothetical protein